MLPTNIAPTLVKTPSAVSHPLHAHQRFVAEHVERFFRDLTANRLRRGVFRDVIELVTAIVDYVDHHHEHPKPFIWTASASDILEKGAWRQIMSSWTPWATGSLTQRSWSLPGAHGVFLAWLFCHVSG